MGLLTVYYARDFWMHLSLLRQELGKRGKQEWLDRARTFDSEDVDTFTPETLVELDFLTDRDRDLFILALFVQVLSKQVCHNYFRSAHDKFVESAKFPRYWGALDFIRDSAPEELLASVHHRIIGKESVPEMREIIAAALEKAGISAEEISRDIFWAKCVKQFPEWLRLDDIVFCDVMGVLCTYRSLMEAASGAPMCFEDRAVRNLNALLRSSGAKIVITSSLRNESGVDLIAHFAKQGVDGEILGFTPFIDDQRALEIRAWLDTRRMEVGRFVILDDEAGGLVREFPDRVVEISSEDGFDEEALRQALLILRDDT